MTITLANTFEGGTSGTTITTGNSGGASGNAFDGMSIGSGATLAFDSTRAAHGGLSAKFATGASSTFVYAQWTASFTAATQIWFREYLYFTQNPGNNHRVLSAIDPTGSALCAAVYVNTDGTMQMINSGGGTIFNTTAKIPLNQWFRIEGFVVGSSTAGQASLSLFDSMDSNTATETDTSAASQNTFGDVGITWWGNSDSDANVGPFWMDDIGVSGAGPLGPATVAHTATASLTVTPSFTAARARGRFRTGSLTVTPSFSAPPARGHSRTGSLLVTPSFSTARTHGHGRTGSLLVVPAFSAARTMAHVRHGSLLVTPSLQALWSGGATPAAQVGSWWGLDAVFKQSRQEFEAYVSRPPVACPNCGEPLTYAPAANAGSGVERFCRYDGWQFPRDWTAPSRPMPW